MKDWKTIINQPALKNLKRVGSPNWNAFLNQGCQIATSLYEQMTFYLEGGLQDKNVLDFGCGIGRALLPLTFDKSIPIMGCDIDATAISYLKKVLPDPTNVVINNFFPPLDFENQFFDVVYSISIWTHLNLEMQFSWLEELSRIVKPGGIVLISIAGHNSLQLRHQRKMDMWEDVSSNELKKKGLIYKEYPRLNTHSENFPGIQSSYGSCLHDPEYIRKNWSDYFEILEIKKAYIAQSQDLVIMRSR